MEWCEMFVYLSGVWQIIASLLLLRTDCETGVKKVATGFKVSKQGSNVRLRFHACAACSVSVITFMSISVL